MKGPRPGTPGYKPPRSSEEILLSHRRIIDGHWIYDGTLTQKGYALLQLGSRVDGTRRKSFAHREAYKIWIGKIPKGWHVHHKCNHKDCFNPRHLKAKSASKHQKDHHAPGNKCKRGHELIGDNVYVRSNGTRMCRKCRRIRRALAKEKVSC